jgi:hypothetical protein
MAQHLREGSQVSVTYENSPGNYSTTGTATVTNLTDAYIEAEVSSTKYAFPWSHVALIQITTD